MPFFLQQFIKDLILKRTSTCFPFLRMHFFVLAIICLSKLCNLGMQSGDETPRPAKLQMQLFPHSQLQATSIQVFCKIIPLVYLGTKRCLSTLRLPLLFLLRSHTKLSEKIDTIIAMATAWCHAYTELWLTFLQYPTKGGMRGRGRKPDTAPILMGETEYHRHCTYCFIHKSAFSHFLPRQHSCEGLPSEPKTHTWSRGASSRVPRFGQSTAGALLLPAPSLGRGLHAMAQKIFAIEVSLKNAPFKCHRYGLK